MLLDLVGQRERPPKWLKKSKQLRERFLEYLGRMWSSPAFSLMSVKTSQSIVCTRPEDLTSMVNFVHSSFECNLAPASTPDYPAMQPQTTDSARFVHSFSNACLIFRFVGIAEADITTHACVDVLGGHRPDPSVVCWVMLYGGGSSYHPTEYINMVTLPSLMR